MVNLSYSLLRYTWESFLRKLRNRVFCSEFIYFTSFMAWFGVNASNLISGWLFFIFILNCCLDMAIFFLREDLTSFSRLLIVREDLFSKGSDFWRSSNWSLSFSVYTLFRSKFIWIGSNKLLSEIAESLFLAAISYLVMSALPNLFFLFFEAPFKAKTFTYSKKNRFSIPATKFNLTLRTCSRFIFLELSHSCFSSIFGRFRDIVLFNFTSWCSRLKASGISVYLYAVSSIFCRKA